MKAKQIPLVLGDLIPATPETIEITSHDAFPVGDLPEVVTGKAPTPEFIEAVKLFGRVIVPLCVVEARGKLIVKDGKRRLRVARMLGLTTVPVRKVVISSVQGSALGVMLNTARAENPISELEMIQEIMKAGGDERLVHAATQMPIGTIRRRLKLLNLGRELRERAFRGEIRTTTAERVAKMSAVDQKKALRILRSTGSLSASDVSGIRKVTTAKSVAALPADMFTVTAPADHVEAWRSNVNRLLQQAAALCPNTAEANALRNSIESLLAKPLSVAA